MSGLLKKLFGRGGETTNVTSDASATSGTTGEPGLLDQAADLFGGGMPDLGELQKAIDGLSQPELEGATTNAMQQLDASTRTDFGQLLQEFLTRSGGAAPTSAGIAGGDPSALGQSLSGLLKSQGVGALAGIFGGASADGGTSSATGGAGGLDVGALLNNPLAKTVLAALVPSILKAFQNRQ